MKTLFWIILILLLTSSCQEKTILLANGKYVTKRKYDRMINNAFKHAEKESRKKLKMTKKQQRDLWNY